MGYFGGTFDIELENELLTQSWQQNIVLSGKNLDGTDSTNDLTYMALESTRKYPLVNPTVTVRLSKDSPDKLYKKCAKCLQEKTGYPFIHNDDVIIKALQELGVPKEDAYNYANDGCWEATIPGSTEFRYSNIELLLCLELALNQGCRRYNDELEGPKTKDPREFETFEELYNTFITQVQAKLKLFVENILKYYGKVYDIAPDPFFSSLIEGCIESAKDLTEGGAKYIFHAPLAAGLSDTANSLATIKKLVFDEKKLTMNEVIDLLDENYENNEYLRQLMSNRVPKYGNDDDYVDDIVLRIIKSYTSLVNEKADNYEWIRFPPGVGTFERYILLGKRVAATPDGRKSGDPISANFSPTIGSDQNGLSACINSFCKVDFTKLPAGSPLNLKVSEKFVRGEEGLNHLIDLIKSFINLRGNMLTIMVQDTETLRKAQKEPENYRNLKVVVGGYQVYFVLLNREHQDYHIKRTEHGLN